MRPKPSILFIFLFTAVLLAPLPALAQSLTIQGKVLDGSNNPITGNATQFRVQILAPDASRCVLYDETRTVDMTTSGGLFSLNLNDSTGTINLPSTYSLDDAISNRAGFAVNSTYCASGSGTVTYTPGPNDNRKVVIQFRDPGTMTGWETIPEMDLNPMAYAMESRTVGGFPATSMLRVVGGGVPGSAPVLTAAEATELQTLAAGTSTRYMARSAANGAQIPSYAGSPSSPTTGSIWFDTTSGEMKYFDGTTTQTVGAAGAGAGDITGVTAGTGLSGGGLSGGVTLSLATSGVTAASYGSASAVPVLTVDTYGRITAATTAAISGTLPSGTSGHFLKSGGGSTWAGASITMGDLKSTIGGLDLFSSPGCTAAQSMYWDSGTDQIKCQAIALNASAITAGQLAVAQGGTGAATAAQNFVFAGPATGGAGAPAFRALTSADLPNGSNPWDVILGGINYAGGNVGIGTTTPASALHVNSTALIGSSAANQTNVSLNAGGPAGTRNLALMYNSGGVNGSVAGDYAAIQAGYGGVGYTPLSLNPSGGHVGIGTATPTATLHVHTGTNRALRVHDTGSAVFLGATTDDGTGSAPMTVAAGTLSFNSGGFSNFVLSNDKAGLGTSSPAAKLHVLGDNNHNLTVESSYASAADAPFILRRSRGTPGSPAIVEDGDGLGSLSFRSFDGSSYRETAGIYGRAVGTPVAGTSVPTDLLFSTGTTSAGERMRITSAGRIGIGTSAPTAKLQLPAGAAAASSAPLKFTAGTNLTTPENGAMEYDGTNYYLTVGTTRYAIPLTGGASSFTTVAAGAGDASNPSLTFSGNSNTGFFSSATNSIGVTTNGAKVFDFTPTGLISPTTGGARVKSLNGDASGPTYGFAGDTDTGWFRAAADTMAASTGGTERMRIDANGNIAIGTTTASSTLHLYSTTDPNQVLIDSVGTVASNVTGRRANGTSASPAAVIAEDNLLVLRGLAHDGTTYSTHPSAAIFMRASGTWTSSSRPGHLTFNTTPVGAVTHASERMRITSEGRVGIGTSIPAAPLHVSKAGNTTTTEPTAMIGDVGLNFTSASDTAINGMLQFPGVGWHNGYFTYYPHTNLGSFFRITGQSVSYGDAATGLIVDGNVGIGTTSPGHKLTVAGADAVFNFNPGTGTPVEGRMRLTSDASANWIQTGDHTTGGGSVKDLYFSGWYGSPFLMALKADGKVGIGTFLPTGQLHVTGPSATFIDRPGGQLISGSHLLLRSSGGTSAAPAATPSGAVLGTLRLTGHNGTAYATDGAGVGAVATEAWNATSYGSALRFLSVPNTTTGSVERMRIDQNGRVGIGTTAPANLLQIAGANHGEGLVVTGNGTPGTTIQTSLMANLGAGAYNSLTQAGDMALIYSGTTISNPNGFVIAPWTATQYGGLRLDTEGNLGIGITNPKTAIPGFAPQKNAMAIPAGYDGFAIVNDSTGSGMNIWRRNFPTGNYMIFAAGQDGSSNAVATGSISTNGVSTSYNTTSDYRLKEHITPLENALSRLQRLQAKRFNYRARPQETVDGFIAHEVQDVVPEAVQGKKDEVDAKGRPVYQTVDYSKVVPLVVGAIQELSAKLFKTSDDVQSLKTELNSVKTENAALKKQNEEILRRLEKLERNSRTPASRR